MHTDAVNSLETRNPSPAGLRSEGRAGYRMASGLLHERLDSVRNQSHLPNAETGHNLVRERLR